MDFLIISGRDVPSGKNREFQEWVRDNSEALSKKTIWRLDSYGAMDQFAAAAGEDSEFARLLDEFGAFGDVRVGADFSGELLKSVADITIWGDYPEEQ
jgi:hypothetical protein